MVAEFSIVIIAIKATSDFRHNSIVFLGIDVVAELYVRVFGRI